MKLPPRINGPFIGSVALPIVIVVIYFPVAGRDKARGCALYKGSRAEAMTGGRMIEVIGGASHAHPPAGEMRVRPEVPERLTREFE